MLDIFVEEDGELRTTSLVLAEKLGTRHSSVIDLIRKFRMELELFGTLSLFEDSSKKVKGDLLHKYYILNDRQAFFLLSCMRSNDQVVAYKVGFMKECFEKKERTYPGLDTPPQL